MLAKLKLNMCNVNCGLSYLAAYAFLGSRSRRLLFACHASVMSWRNANLRLIEGKGESTRETHGSGRRTCFYAGTRLLLPTEAVMSRMPPPLSLAFAVSLFMNKPVVHAQAWERDRTEKRESLKSRLGWVENNVKQWRSKDWLRSRRKCWEINNEMTHQLALDSTFCVFFVFAQQVPFMFKTLSRLGY